MKSYQQHALSAAWPSMSADEFQTLKDSIENVGVLHSIILFEGQVIDGWHRYKAANELGMPCPSVELDDTDPVDFVKAMNEARRHLTASQRAIAIVAIFGWRPAGQQKKNMEPSSTLEKTNAELAKEAGVSTKTIQQAKDAHKAGLSDPVKEGAMTVKEASNTAKGKPKKEKPKLKPKAKPAPPVVETSEPEDDYTQLDEANDTIKGLQDSLAVATMGEISEDDKAQAAVLISGLRARIKTLEATLKAVTISRDTFQDENAELRKQINRQRKEIDRATGKKTA